MNTAAKEVYQKHLDVSTRLVVEGDAEGYSVHAQLPFVFRTAEGIEVIETVKDLTEDIRQIHEWLRTQGVTDYHRIAREARYLDADTVEGFHVTYALRGALPVVEPYASRMILKRAGDLWKTTYAEHELADALYPGHNARARHGLFATKWSAPAPGTPPHDHAGALAAYQSVLDGIARASIDDDLEALLRHYAMPYDVHFDEGSSTVSTADGAREFHDMLQRMIRAEAADRLVLEATFAVFLSDDQLLGYHEASLMRCDERRFGPVRSRVLMTNRNGPWQVKSISNAISTTGWNSGRMIISPVLPTMREIKKRMKT